MNGAYRVSSYSGNVFATGSFGVIDVVVNASYARMNAVLTTSGSSYQYYTRLAWGSEWQDWQRVDSFGCKTPEALASLLGVFKYQTNNTVNVDDFTGGIVYVNGVGSGTWPFSTTYAYGSILLAVPGNGGLRIAQLVFRYGYGIWYRLKSDDTWGAWEKISNL